MREEIRRFAELMEAQLKRNDWKGGWKNDSSAWLFGRLLEEVWELYQVLFAGETRERIAREAADVANFAMMLADQERLKVEEA